ncbi:glycerol-3-phosphate responsive antiterminator [Hespellia stercorisuis]|uniref:Glycerol uptake operon antiterminator n=1 Tax=Hespellia stercorisuis DSM 15480 TaxID=1121950 RepID=A0A1M6KM91_9FIRM|nr:glycerol-3-phosphate responsive antiterminator [Hespellia stercorisuis]SHJ60138.1 glycerol uptake operon antiterminator [Hespellia stercorisuis DSM 15480]
MEQRIYDSVAENPIIAAVKDMEGLNKCIKLEDVKMIFILFGDINTINSIVEMVKASGKLAMVHIDLLVGLSAQEVSVDFIKMNTQADGIITTKQRLVRRGKELGLCTILRMFILDSLSLENVKKQVNIEKPDIIEILPGVMPKIIRRICSCTKIPVIAGGLIADKEDIVGALNAGAIAVSSTNENVWEM